MSKLILIVDDEESSRKYLSTILTENGYGVDTAEDGSQCLKKASEQRPDLVILDIMMPNVSGITALKELRRSETLHDVPVIILSEVMTFIEKAREEIDDKEVISQMESLLDNIGSPTEKFLLRFRAYRKAVLGEREAIVEKFKHHKTVGIASALPDLFIDKPVDPDNLLQGVKELLKEQG